MRYLRDEAIHKGWADAEAMPALDVWLSEWTYAYGESPRQTDGSSCGVFVIMVRDCHSAYERSINLTPARCLRNCAEHPLPGASSSRPFDPSI